MLAPKQRPLKPPSPLQPKNAPKTPISRPQRRWRFQPHARTSEQRRRRFQESGPPGLQDPDAIPVAGGGAWPGDQWAADVTNVVKPTRFKSPREDLCYKRRQSEPKNQHFQRKSRWIDDVCNNTRQARRQHTRHHLCGGRRRGLPRCRWAAAGPGRASRRRAERSSRRGRLAGGPPPTGTHSGRARRRPEHQRRHKHHRTEKP